MEEFKNQSTFVQIEPDQTELDTQLIPAHIQRTIYFHNLCYKVPIDKPKSTKTILNRVSGVLRPNRLTVILGSSGAGKTSLLNVLAGQAKFGSLSGEILINGKKATGKILRKMSGFVHQEDVTLDTQTVREAIHFSAKLRIPPPATEREIAQRTEEVISLMHLQKAANTFIGSALIKGVSGGEKKRTCIGLELVTNPTIMFLDEPTSGLDTYNAFSVVRSLKRLARTGRTIIATLHQPSSEIFHMIDDLILMADGHIIYYGTAEDSVDYFTRHGFQCPKYSNPADFFFMSVFNNAANSVEASTDSLPNDSDETKGKELKATMSKEQHEKPLQLVDAWNASPNSLALIQEIQNNKIEEKDKLDDKSGLTFRAGFWMQLYTLYIRGWKNAMRNKMVFWVKVLQAIPIAIFIDLIYWQIPNRETSAQAQDRAGLLFFLVANQIFSNSFSALNLFATERLVFQREYDARMYGLGAYFMTKALVDIPILLLVPFMLSSIVYFATGLQLIASKFLLFVIIVILMAGCGHALGLWAAATFANVNVGLAVMPLLILPLMIFSGLFVNVSALPVWIRWVQWLSPMKYGFVALMQNELDDLLIPCAHSSPEIELRGGCVETGEVVLKRYGLDNQGSIAVNSLALLGFWILLWVLSFVGFMRMVRRSKGSFRQE